MSNVALGHEYDATSAPAKYQHDQSMIVVQLGRKVAFRANRVRELAARGTTLRPGSSKLSWN